MKQLSPQLILALRAIGCSCALLGPAAADAQRVQFPTMVEQNPSGVPPQAFSTTQAPTYAPGPYTPPAGSVYGGPGAPPPSSFGGPPAVAGPAWDPYSTGAPAPVPYTPVTPAPYVAGPQPLYPDGAPSIFPQGGVFSSLDQPLRFLQEIRFRETWLAGDVGSNPTELDVNDVEVSATFAFPFFYNQAPLLVTPGFAVHYWEGPVTTAATGFADLPPRTYDAFLDFAWHPQLTTWLGANLGVRTGVYSDFESFNSRSLRIMGRALGILTFTPTLQIAAGVVYLDRNEFKLLPAGGVIYIPTEDSRYEFLFPNPKLARRFTTVGTVDVWGYLSAELGGGSWTADRIVGGNDSFDYNDIRVMAGIETLALSGLKTHFEVGYVFDREVVYRFNPPQSFEPDDTFMLRAGLSY